MPKNISYFVLLAAPLFLAGISALAAPTFTYEFKAAGTLKEAPSASQSTSPYWWLKSGGALTISDGIGATIQGDLATSSALGKTYASKFTTTSDGGLHPQNIFRLLTKNSFAGQSQQIDILITGDHLTNSSNVQPFNGAGLVSRYQDDNNYYIASLRMDGGAAIKKKQKGSFVTLAQASNVLPGTFSKTNPDLLPQNAWMSLKSEIVSNLDGSATIKFSLDKNHSGAWQTVVTATDKNPIMTNGLGGLFSDFVDLKMDNYIINDGTSITTPPTSTTTPPANNAVLDKFGIRELYPNAMSGKQWFANWASSLVRTFTGIDPQDPWFDANHGNATYKVDGAGQLIISGAVPRMYIHDPSHSQGWHNVEMTVYAKRVADSSTPWGGIEGVARTNHGTVGGTETSNLCDTRGIDARIRYDGHTDFEKETGHPASVAVNNKTLWSSGMPYNTWIGYKFVVYDLPDGNVKLESYMDTTDGASGGTWQKINELVDTGNNFGVGGTPCKAGTDPAMKLTNSDARTGSESGKPNATVYWRSDDVGTNGLIYKNMSVREISAGL